MDEKENKIDTDEILKKQFAKLPPVIQQAITGASVEKHLRMLSNKHKLHLDQWQILENEVTMTLMGMQEAEELEENIKKEVGVDAQTARELANDIALEVFDPIRKEMERQLEHPEAQPKKTEPIEDLRSEILAKAKANTSFSEPEEDILDTDDQATPTTQEHSEVLPNLETEVSQSAAPPPSTQENTSQSAETPTALKPEVKQKPKTKRSPVSGEYTPGGSSTERGDIKDDPYRESVDA